jgi:hypothetical protein
MREPTAKINKNYKRLRDENDNGDKSEDDKKPRRWSAKLKVENVLFMMILSVFLNFTIFDVRPNHFPVLRTFYQHNSSIPDISLCCCQFMQPVNHSMRLFFVSRQCRLTHRLLSAKRTSSSANNCLGVQRHVFLLLAL